MTLALLHLALAAAVLPLSSQEPAQAAASSKVWLGRATDFEEFLRTAPIQRFADIPVGVTKPRRAFFATGGLAASAVVKDLPPGRAGGFWESYKSEIAAYELDKLLELGMVPVTVERRVEGQLVSAQLWVENCELLKKLTSQNKASKDVDAWNLQIHRQRVFDNLIGNIDRNAGNLLVDPVWNLILIDHSRAFTDTGKMLFESQMRRVDRGLFARLKTLDEATLSAHLGHWVVNRACVRAILKRRDRIVAHFERLAAEQGEGAVFIP